MCTLWVVNSRKAAGPDGVTVRVLRDCADQLEDFLTYIFNQSLSQCMILPCLKSSIPVPKKSTTNCLNDFDLSSLSILRNWSGVTSHHVCFSHSTPIILHTELRGLQKMPLPQLSIPHSHTWNRRQLCQAALHRIQLCLQHSYTKQTCHYTVRLGVLTTNLPLDLKPFDRPHSEG